MQKTVFIAIALLTFFASDIFAQKNKQTVSSGTSDKLHKYRKLYKYTLPKNRKTSDILGVSIRGWKGISSVKGYDLCLILFKDGKLARGKSDQFVGYWKERLKLPKGKKYSDIVGIAHVKIYRHYVWFKDGTVVIYNNLSKPGKTYKYTVARGRKYTDIIGIAISSKDRCYAWYKNGTASSGTSYNLAKHKTYQYLLAPGKKASDVVGIAISKKNDRCYVWYK